MATQTETIETLHEDLIVRVSRGESSSWAVAHTPPSLRAQHDAQLDYYGKKLATCSSDCTIRIYDKREGTAEHVELCDLRGHDGPVWQVAWAHPQYGVLLASCSYDRKVKIWKEQSPSQWDNVYTFDGHESSVNAVAWAPPELGLVLACASADAKVSILTHNSDDTWSTSSFVAHQIGCNAVSWAPAYQPAAAVSSATNDAQLRTSARLVTGGCDNLVKVWQHDPDTQQWSLAAEDTLMEHTDWVRDVAWAPIAATPVSVIASCSQDHRVLVWSKGPAATAWKCTALPTFEAPVWRVSWSLTGGILAVSTADNKVRAPWPSPSRQGDWALAHCGVASDRFPSGRKTCKAPGLRLDLSPTASRLIESRSW